MKRLLLSVAGSCLLLSAGAQTPQLVEDIYVGKAHGRPGGLTLLNGKIYFGAADMTGKELWEWHAMGTPAVKISDSHPGPNSSWYHDDRIPMAVFNGGLHYRGFTSTTSHNMMSYNGTGMPMAAVANVSSPSGTGCSWLTPFSNKLYYVADSMPGYRGYMFSYDGSTTSYVTKMSANANTANWMPVMIPFQGKLIFAKDTTGKGIELFSYDPATSKLSLVADIAPGARTSNPREFLAGNNKLYFVATDSAHGDELWCYDGTAVSRLTDVAPGTANGISVSSWSSITFYKGGLYFSGANAAGYSALYKFDTTLKTVSIACDPKLSGNSGGSAVTGLYATPHNLYFYANNPTTTGIEPWKFDGTQGTMLGDINPGKASGAGFSNFLLFEGYVFFAAGDTATTGTELYRVYDQPTNVGVSSSHSNVNAAVYPNPVLKDATLVISTQGAEALQVSLVDVTGKTLFTKGLQITAAGNHDTKLPLAHLPSGNYFYRIHNKTGVLLTVGGVVKP